MLASELGTDPFDPIPDEPNLVVHPGDDHGPEPGERRCTPVGSVRAPVAPRRHQTADASDETSVSRRARETGNGLTGWPAWRCLAGPSKRPFDGTAANPCAEGTCCLACRAARIGLIPYLG
jgi:hypothetical protein